MKFGLELVRAGRARFRFRFRLRSVTCAASLVAVAGIGPTVTAAVAEESHLIVIAGLGGEDRYRERFHEWAMAMRQAAIERYGLAPERVVYLGEDPSLSPSVIHAKSTKENVTSVFAELEKQVSPGDQVFVLLIGHGSYRSEQSRFNLPGPDLTAADFDAMLKPFAEQEIVFVNTASASGSFVPIVSGPNRIVITATKSGMERNETLFGKYFVEAYSGDGADADKNERVSVLEAFLYATGQVEKHYETENLLRTEHAVLDDDGDGEGVTDPGEAQGDLASAAYLFGERSVVSGPSAVELDRDPELKQLVARKEELERRVASLRTQRDSMPETLYMEELESILLELAETSRKIEEKRQQ